MTAIILRRRKLGKKSAEGIIAAASNTITQVRNWKSRDWENIDDDVSYVFRWGCTSTVESGGKVVNKADAIHWCGNKRQSRLEMQDAGVPVPFTVDYNGIAPSELDGATWIARPATHSQGRNMLVGNLQVCQKWIRDYFRTGYCSVKIDKVAEYRVFVCQNRVSWVARKTPANPDDVAWNVARGGKFDNVRWSEWPLRVIKAALEAASISGTDFCGVDVMVDRHGNPYVLEANSAPSQTSPYRQSCVAKSFDYIIENGVEPFPPIHGRSYRDYIHPAVLN